MKNILHPVILLFVLSCTTLYGQAYKKMIEDGNHTLTQIQKSAEKYFEKTGMGKGTGYKQYKRWEYFAMKQLDVNGYVKDPSYLFDELRTYNRRRNSRKSNTLLKNGASWSELGPNYYNETSGWNPGVGRLSSFAVDKRNPNHIIVGSIGGGIWKTTSKGRKWTPLTDNHGNMYTYSLSMDSRNSNVYYWGSSKGKIFKSVNGGRVWSQVGTAGRHNILKILIHPTNSQILYACSHYSGLYKSINGGKSWKLLKRGAFYDVELDPNNSSTIFATGRYVFRSTDAGASFTQIRGFTTGAKMIGVSKANSKIVYIVEARGRYFNALYKSTNNGVSFQKLNHNGKNFFGYHPQGLDKLGQAPRDMGIAVSPTNPNEVHIAGINTWRSVNGGKTFTNTSQWRPRDAKNKGIGYCHADVDDLEFVGNELYVVTDGGIFVCRNTKNITKDYYQDLTRGLGIRQFYLLGVSQTKPVVIVSGSQDNGTSIYRKSRRNKGEWIDWLGADGFEGIVDVKNPKVIYGTIYNGTMYKTTNQGNSYRSVRRPEKTGWVTPLEQDKYGALYFGGKFIYKSTNGGSSWQKISQDLKQFANQVKIAPSNRNMIYASTGGGRYLYKTTNGGRTKNWTRLYGFQGRINSLAVHPRNSNKIALALTGTTNKVMVSEDGGRTWKSFSSGLPNFSPYVILWDDNGKDGLYVGMDYGIYYRDKNVNSWQAFDNNLPNVKVTELEINYADGYLYASTYGRGIWRSPRAKQRRLHLAREESTINQIQMYPNVAGEFVNLKVKEEKNVTIKLFDFNGRLVRFYKNTTLHEDQDFQIPTIDLPKGIYFMRINDKQETSIKKIVVE